MGGNVGGCAVVGQPVAHAGLGQQEARLGRIGFDLGAQLAHVQPQVVRVFGELRPPHVGQQRAVRDHLPGVADQPGEQLVLGRRQVQRRAVQADVAGGEVDVEAVVLVAGDGRAERGAAVAQRDPHARQQLADAERFGQVVVGARVEQADLAPVGLVRRDDQHRRAAVLAQLGQQRVAAAVRQAEVQQHQIDRRVPQQRPRLGHRRGRAHLVPLDLQRRTQHLAQFRVVLDQQDLQHRQAP